MSSVLNTHATHQWLKTHVKHKLKKGANEVQLPAAQLQELRTIFSLIDEDGSGSLDPAELREAFAKVGMRSQQAEDVIKTLRRSRKRELTFEDFAAAMTQVASAEFKSLQEEQRASSAFTQLQEFAVLQERKKIVREIHAGKPASAAYAKFATLFEGYPETDIPRQDQSDPAWIDAELRLMDAKTVPRPDQRWETFRQRRFEEGHSRAAAPTAQHIRRKPKKVIVTKVKSKKGLPHSADLRAAAGLKWQGHARVGKQVRDASPPSTPTSTPATSPTNTTSRARHKAKQSKNDRSAKKLSRARWPVGPLQSQRHFAEAMALKPFIQQRRVKQNGRKNECGLRQWKRPGPSVSGLLVPLKCTAVAQDAGLQPFIVRPEMVLELPKMVRPPVSRFNNRTV